MSEITHLHPPGAPGPGRGAWVPGAPRPVGLEPDSRHAPWWPLYLTEPVRAVGEFSAWPIGSMLLRRAVPRGDGHPVLVLPGLLAGDGSTSPLRGFLRSLGYRTYGWRLGRNVGPTARVLRGVRDMLAQMTDHYDRPVTVIGWSLGGIYARELAREFPDQVRGVITLGSPFRLAHPQHTRALRAFHRYSHLHVPVDELPPPESTRPPIPVPSTSIYSTLDGIVSWRACLESPGAGRENIAVWCSHLGLGHHPAVAYAVADRLAQPAGGWRPFRAPLWARACFPAPAEGTSVLA